MKNVKTVQSGMHKISERELLEAGIKLDPKEDRSANFVQIDNSVHSFSSFFEGIELLPTKEAIKDPYLAGYFGKAFARLNKTSKMSDVEGGFFLKVKAGANVVLPVQVCLFLKSNSVKQRVHNVILVEEGARVYVINGCASKSDNYDSFHFGTSEYFVRAGGYLNFTMIHSWNKNIEVLPKSVAVVEENAVFVSNYICLNPVKLVKMYPTCFLEGKYAKASFASLIVGHEGSVQDIGSRVILKHEQTSAEIVSRAVSMGGNIVMRGHLKAEAETVKAHLECQGLVVGTKGCLHAIPELETSFADVDMSHEAAIGKISKEEIEYIASRGIDETTAQSVIIRGFIDTDILGLPRELKEQIEKLKDKLTVTGV